jgi:hypothetical protein
MLNDTGARHPVGAIDTPIRVLPTCDGNETCTCVVRRKTCLVRYPQLYVRVYMAAHVNKIYRAVTKLAQ